MFLRIARADIKHNRSATVVAGAFIFLAALLFASALGTVATLGASVRHFMERADLPDFLYLHSGDLEPQQVARFAAAREDVAEHQIITMLTLPAASIGWGSEGVTDVSSVMDISLVTQSPHFDFLLDDDNEVAQVRPGEIGVPVFLLRAYDLSVGDLVRLRGPNFQRELRISTPIRDAQMNASIVSSKRMLVHPQDWREIAASLGGRESLIEFNLQPGSDIAAFQFAYERAGLPQQGPAITRTLFILVNAFDGGVVIAAVVALSAVLTLVAFLCLRYIILTGIEENYETIGMLKAVGLNHALITRIYLMRYVALAVLAGAGAYPFSFLLMPLLTQSFAPYVGLYQPGVLVYALPLLAVVLTGLVTVFYSAAVLRRTRRISPVAALRGVHENRRRGAHVGLERQRGLPLTLSLGLARLSLHPRPATTLFIVVALALIVAHLPLSLVSTLRSPSFIRYMGVGESDLRLDVTAFSTPPEAVERFAGGLSERPEVREHSLRAASLVTFELGGDEAENVLVEVGNFSQFPLSYSGGQAPQREGELAISHLLARSTGLALGDTVRVRSPGSAGTQNLQVVGIYQDVTNGGRTAQAVFPGALPPPTRYTIYATLAPGADLEQVAAQFSAALPNARVTPVASYVQETFGGTLEQLQRVAILALSLAIFLCALIAALLVHMLLGRDADSIAVAQALGLTRANLRAEYLVMFMIPTLLGTVTALAFNHLLLPLLARFTLQPLGLSQLVLETNPWISYLGVPALGIACTLISVLLNLRVLGRQPLVAGLRG